MSRKGPKGVKGIGNFLLYQPAPIHPILFGPLPPFGPSYTPPDKQSSFQPLTFDQFDIRHSKKYALQPKIQLSTSRRSAESD